MMDKFSGGESGWNEWSGDFRTMVQTKNEAAGETLIYIKTAGKMEKSDELGKGDGVDEG